jgi:hypothetical protein
MGESSLTIYAGGKFLNAAYRRIHTVLTSPGIHQIHRSLDVQQELTCVTASCDLVMHMTGSVIANEITKVYSISSMASSKITSHYSIARGK